MRYCYAMPCCAVLCCAMLCCAVLCCDVMCCAVPCCAVPCRAVLCCAVPCRAVPCCAVLCCAVLCCAVPCCAVLCCAVPCRAHLAVEVLPQLVRVPAIREGRRSRGRRAHMRKALGSAGERVYGPYAMLCYCYAIATLLLRYAIATLRYCYAIATLLLRYCYAIAMQIAMLCERVYGPQLPSPRLHVHSPASLLLPLPYTSRSPRTPPVYSGLSACDHRQAAVHGTASVGHSHRCRA